MSSGAESSVDELAGGLQEATERLTTALLGDAPPGELVAAQAERERAFEALRARAAQGEALTQTGRAALRMVRELDLELIALGTSLKESIRGERRDLARRRRTIAAHARRERGLPRALTVKA